ncbi:MAG: RodZ domain-containing protein [Pseudomonadota bacterium]
MTEESQSPDEVDETHSDSSDDQAESASGAPIAGERLAEARREQQISVVEVAKELHLDETKVRALERNEFETLGAPVFAKGHLRKYAQVVGVNEADILDDYYTLTRASDPPPVVVNNRRPRREVSPGPLIAIAILIAFVIFAYYWFVLRDRTLEAIEATEQVEAEPVTESAALASEPAEDAVEAAPIEIADEAPTVEEVIADEPPVIQPIIDDGQIDLLLTFSGDCWTEISDADGRRLFYNMGRANQTANLTGIAPISILFGAPDSVTLQVNGSDYRVPDSTSVSGSVRFTINDNSAS